MSKTSMPANFLNRHPLPSITGLPASGPMLPSPSTAVPFVTTRDQVAARCQRVRLARIAHDLVAGFRHAGRIRERQIPLRHHRLGRHDRDLAVRGLAVIFERGVAQVLGHGGLLGVRAPSQVRRARARSVIRLAGQGYGVAGRAPIAVCILRARRCDTRPSIAAAGRLTRRGRRGQIGVPDRGVNGTACRACAPSPNGNIVDATPRLPVRREGAVMTPQRLRLALAVAAACAITLQPSSSVGGDKSFDPLLDDAATCVPARAAGRRRCSGSSSSPRPRRRPSSRCPRSRRWPTRRCSTATWGR